ncbi:hypothetical protein ACLOJK_021354 [Asimina triloba]
MNVCHVIAVRAINAIFQQWWGGQNISSGWNISGEPCSGTALGSSTVANPGIKCDCSYGSGSTCHITQMYVPASMLPTYSAIATSLSLSLSLAPQFQGLNVIGVIPDELQNLTFLQNLLVSQNYLTGPLPAFIGDLTAMKYLSVSINALSGSIPKELGKLQNLISL